MSTKYRYGNGSKPYPSATKSCDLWIFIPKNMEKSWKIHKFHRCWFKLIHPHLHGTFQRLSNACGTGTTGATPAPLGAPCKSCLHRKASWVDFQLLEQAKQKNDWISDDFSFSVSKKQNGTVRFAWIIWIRWTYILESHPSRLYQPWKKQFA